MVDGLRVLLATHGSPRSRPSRFVTLLVVASRRTLVEILGVSRRNRRGCWTRDMAHPVLCAQPTLSSLSLCRVVPSSPYISAMKPKQIVYPEDHLINAYYNRNPHARFYPIDLTSNQPHFVRNFAKRQLKVQRQRRVSEQEALAIVEAEAEDEDRRAKEAMEAGRKFVRHLTPTHDIEKNWIRRVQAEEEKAWQISKSIHVMEHYRELMKSGMDNIFDESDNETKERRADEEEARQVMSDSGLERHEVNMALKHLKELSEGDLEEIVSNLGEGSSEPHSR